MLQILTGSNHAPMAVCKQNPCPAYLLQAEGVIWQEAWYQARITWKSTRWRACTSTAFAASALVRSAQSHTEDMWSPSRGRAC